MDPVQEQLEAYNAHDIERFVACFTPDAVARRPDGESIVGQAAIRERWSTAFAAKPYCTLVGRMRTGPWTIDEELVSLDGGARMVRALVAYRVEGGLISLMWSLWADGATADAWPMTLLSASPTP